MESWIIAILFVSACCYLVWRLVESIESPHMSKKDIERRIGKK